MITIQAMLDKDEKFAMTAQEAYRLVLEEFFNQHRGHPDFDCFHKVLEMEWRKVLANPRRVKIDSFGKPLARILWKDKIPYFNLLPNPP